MPEEELALPPEDNLNSPPKLDTQRQQKAREYGRIERRFTYIQSLIIAAAALVLIFGGLSASFAAHLVSHPVWAAVI